MIDTASPLHPAPSFQLDVDAWGHLVFFAADGTRHEKVTAIRAFPMTAPERWVSIRTAAGQELALVKDPAMLPTPVRTLLDLELSRREFSPRITQVHSVQRADFGILWTVETDRGPVTFTMESEESIRGVGDRGAVIVDSHGIRYRIIDILELDRPSRRRLEKYF